MKQPVLTFCINNASQDDMRAVAASFQQRFPGLIDCVRHEINYGWSLAEEVRVPAARRLPLVLPEGT